MVVTSNGTTYTGVANGQTVFTMTINANGSYTFTQLGQLDHANTTNPNDSLDLRFGVKATDADGDVGNTTVTIRVFDDGPDIGSITRTARPSL